MLTPPYQWFGGKRRVASEVWRRFGDVYMYVEPFFGSGAVLLANPYWQPGKRIVEVVGDLDGFVANFWRAVAKDPDEVLRWADWPMTDNDKQARNLWLIHQEQDLVAKLEADPFYCDFRIAGWWLWGQTLSYGLSWCKPAKAWIKRDNKLVRNTERNTDEVGIRRQSLNVPPNGVIRWLSTNGYAGREKALDYLHALAKRMRYVMVLTADWRVTVNKAVAGANVAQPVGIFFDPPYGSLSGRFQTYIKDSFDVAGDVRRFCLERGNEEWLRIALCGFVGEHDQEMLDAGWKPYYWRNTGGLSALHKNSDNKALHKRRDEVIWFSPHCLNQDQTESGVSPALHDQLTLSLAL